MKVDYGARGRAAALEVRRSKKQERQAAVRNLEKRGVPRMQMRAELKSLGFTGSLEDQQLELAPVAILSSLTED
jgi:hypothetical protein